MSPLSGAWCAGWGLALGHGGGGKWQSLTSSWMCGEGTKGRAADVGLSLITQKMTGT